MAHGSARPCGLAAGAAWQLAQAGLARPGACGVWQLVHAWWPGGAVAASLRWQLPQAAGGALGACGAVAWQLAQAAWPVPRVVAARSA